VHETAKVLSQCDLLIAPSTAMTLIADAVKTPVLLLEGPMVTSRAHPLMARYCILRKFISCAPCFQLPMWNFCNEPRCMNLITVGDVIQKMYAFLPKLATQNYKWQIDNGEIFEGQDYNCSCKVLYLMPCHNRYEILRECLDSFKASRPQPGTLILLNDRSTDPRIRDLLLDFSCEGIEIIYIESESDMIRTKTPSIPVYNFLIQKALELPNLEKFEYMTLIDPDTLFRSGWCQKLILTYEGIKEKHPGVKLFSSFNTEHPIFKERQLFQSEYGQYVLSDWVGLQIMMETSFLESFGFYKDGSSADLGKAKELVEMGYECMNLMPSMTEHVGAFYSTFPHRQGGCIAKDFI